MGRLRWVENSIYGKGKEICEVGTSSIALGNIL